MKYLVDLLQPLLDEKGQVVWYDSELAANETYPKIKVILTQSAPHVDFVLIDADSGDMLDAQNGVPNVMRREDEDDLL